MLKIVFYLCNKMIASQQNHSKPLFIGSQFAQQFGEEFRQWHIQSKNRFIGTQIVYTKNWSVLTENGWFT